MTRAKALLAMLLLLALAVGWRTSFAQATEDASVGVTLAPAALEVGGRFALTFELPGSASYEQISVEIPPDQSHLWRLGEPERLDDNTFVLAGRALLRGEHRMGPFTIRATREGSGTEIRYEADAAELEVIPPDGEFTGELRDLTAPLEVPFNYLWRNIILVASALLGLALLGLLVYLLARLLARRVARVIEPVPVDPLEEALSGIGTLKRGDFLRTHGVERFYTRLSTVLRRYMEREFKRPVLEMSDDETVDLLSDRFGWLHHSSELAGVMRRSSMAKYARQEMAEPQAMKDCGTVEQFLVAEEQRKRSLELTERAAQRVRRERGEGKAA